MDLVKKSDHNILVLTDIEIMTLANILNHYKLTVPAGFNARKVMAAKIANLIEEKIL